MFLGVFVCLLLFYFCSLLLGFCFTSDDFFIYLLSFLIHLLVSRFTLFFILFYCSPFLSFSIFLCSMPGGIWISVQGPGTGAELLWWGHLV